MLALLCVDALSVPVVFAAYTGARGAGEAT
jgi:hypothetical protein